jgi:hypothetical protein
VPSTTLVAIALIVVAVVFADRASATIMRKRVARLIASAWRTTTAPELRIGGGPFLIQLIGGVYRRVRLTWPAFTAGGMDFRGLDATLRDVRAPVARLLAGDGLVAGEISATFAIPFATLNGRLPPGFALRRHRQELQIHGTMLAVPVSGVVEINAERRQIVVTPRIAGVPSLVGFRIEFPAMPQEVTIISVIVTDTALAVGVAGREVSIAARAGDRATTGEARRMRPWRTE